MSTTSEELKKLYKKLGGDEENIRKASTPAEILNGINELDLTIPGGIEDLADVDISDPKAGDVIRHNGEKWVNDQEGSSDVSKTATGNPIEISDGANAPLVKCVTAITGSQDLHGYDKPWVGGAGKNKLPTATSASYSGVTFTVNSDGSVKVVADGTATNTYSIDIPVTLEDGVTYTASGITGGSSSTYQVYLQTSGGGATSAGNITSGSKTWTQNNSDYAVGIYRIRVVSGATVNTTIYPMIEQGSTATTYAPYSNICPITAYTEGEIEVRGKNLWNGEWEEGDIDATTGQDISGSGVWRTKGYISISLLTQYFVATDGVTGASIRPRFYDATKNYIGTTTALTGYAFNTPNNAMYLRFAPNASIVPNKTIGINYPSTYTTYKPYTSTTHTTTYPSAIYRGSEDVVEGEVTSEWVKTVFSGEADEAWDYNSANQAFFCVNGLTTPYVDNSRNDFALCNMAEQLRYNAVSGSEMVDGKFCIGMSGANNILYFKNTNFTSVSDFKTWLSTNNLEVAYELATPTTSSVTPTNLPIKSLNGYSHIESSTGDMDIDYINGAYDPLIQVMSKQVVANPTDAASETLTGLKVGDTTYSVPQGGGGSIQRMLMNNTITIE